MLYEKSYWYVIVLISVWMEIIVEMLEEVVLYFCRYVIKNILKFFKNLMKIKNWIVVVEKFKEDEMYILLKNGC